MRVRTRRHTFESVPNADANITETLYVPEPPDRKSSPPYLVDLTAEQLEGYLFLAHLGEKGGNPLTRSVLLTEHD
jgi:hypothetical protein